VVSLVRRIGGRCLGSIVPVPSPPDFPLENEPVLGYEKGSAERAELEKALDKMSNECEEVPLVIGNEEIRTDLCKHQVMVGCRFGFIRAFARTRLDLDSSDLRLVCGSVVVRSLTITRGKSPDITGRRRTW